MVKIFDTGININVKELDTGIYMYYFTNDEGDIINTINSRSHPDDLSNYGKVIKALNKILSKADKIAYATNHNIVCINNNDFKQIQELMLKDIRNTLSQSIIVIDTDIIRTTYGTVYIKDRNVIKCSRHNNVESPVLTHAVPKSIKYIDEGIEVCFKNARGKDTYIKGADVFDVCSKLKEVFGQRYRNIDSNYDSMVCLLESMLEEE